MKKLLAFLMERVVVSGLCLVLAAQPSVFAQDHVVSPAQLQKDLASSSAARRENQQQLERFLSSKRAQEALQSAHIDYKQVRQAVGTLSDTQMAELASRSSQAQKDFAAGAVSSRGLLLILVGIAVLILIIVAAK